ncbi:MAG: hypothetical protein H0T86_16265 [Gemmatimonadales bacterium]|nr:hypothetical protein [Gemmatimonadales bacterium]
MSRSAQARSAFSILPLALLVYATTHLPSVAAAQVAGASGRGTYVGRFTSPVASVVEWKGEVEKRDQDGNRSGVRN